jgi:hypothetical protein
MFGKWLGLLRSGPDLLRATSSDREPYCVETGECEAPQDGVDDVSSRDAAAQLRRCEPGKVARLSD